MNKFIKNLMMPIAGMVLLSGCALIGGAVDAVNPFDETEADKLKKQGDVAGDDQRISLLTAEESLTPSGELTAQDVILPATYVNADWPQPGGNSGKTVLPPMTPIPGSLYGGMLSVLKAKDGLAKAVQIYLSV